MRSKYGLSLVDYQKLADAQENVCAICGGPPKGRGAKLYVDHNHGTGKIRGLLCVTCNAGIGQFQDCVNLLQRAINYLERANSIRA